jgi:hypothetical protein
MALSINDTRADEQCGAGGSRMSNNLDDLQADLSELEPSSASGFLEEYLDDDSDVDSEYDNNAPGELPRDVVDEEDPTHETSDFVDHDDPYSGRDQGPLGVPEPVESDDDAVDEYRY